MDKSLTYGLCSEILGEGDKPELFPLSFCFKYDYFYDLGVVRREEMSWEMLRFPTAIEGRISVLVWVFYP